MPDLQQLEQVSSKLIPVNLLNYCVWPVLGQLKADFLVILRPEPRKLR
jgi:hypothetical protein